MGGLYFNTRGGDRLTVLKAEKHHLGRLAARVGSTGWQFDRSRTWDITECERFLDLLAPDQRHIVPRLRDLVEAAVAEDAANAELWAAHEHGPYKTPPPTKYTARAELTADVERTLRHAESLSVVFEVAGHRMQALDVILNTALLLGSEPIRLAAKIDGHCEQWMWVEGPDRSWLADVIEEALDHNLYRRTLHVPARENQPAETLDVGWQPVLDMLRADASGPVVISYSAGASFPADVPQAFDVRVAGLREHRSWARLGPETIANVWFGIPVTIFDLLADDRAARVRAAASQRPYAFTYLGSEEESS